MQYRHKPTGAVVTASMSLPLSEWEPIDLPQRAPAVIEAPKAEKPKRQPRARKGAEPKEQ